MAIPTKNFTLSSEIFKISDIQNFSSRIEAFIEQKRIELNRDGIVVPLSGGLDSSTVATLCVRASGNRKVTGLLLPEKKGNPDALKYSLLVAERLKIQTKTIDISKILSAMGSYDFIINKIPSRKLVEQIVKKVYKNARSNPFIDGIKGTGNSFVRSGRASNYTKHRIRMAVAFKLAEEKNLLVAGCAHKSEDMLGLFCKFGIDDNADIMPIKNLYRSHILQLAEYIGVPDEILKRPPNPDVLPGIEDKYFDLLGVRSEQIDLIIYGLETKLDFSLIAEASGVTVDKIRELDELMMITEHMRNHSMPPDFELFPKKLQP